MSGNVKTGRQHRAMVRAARLVRYSRLRASDLLARLTTPHCGGPLGGTEPARRPAVRRGVNYLHAGACIAPCSALQYRWCTGLVRRSTTGERHCRTDWCSSHPGWTSRSTPRESGDGRPAAGRGWPARPRTAVGRGPRSRRPHGRPLFGPLTALPPITVYAGTLDVIYPDTERLVERARAESVAMDVAVREGLVHIWSLFTFLPETRAVRPQTHRALIGDTA